MTGPEGDPLADDGALGPASRALLDAARAGLSPDAAAVRRVRAGVHGAVTGAAAGTAIAAKLGIVAIVVTVAAGAALYARHRSAPGAPVVSPVVSPVGSQPAAPVAPQPAAPAGGAGAALPSTSAAVDPELITIETALDGASPARSAPALAAPAPARTPPHRRASASVPARPVPSVASAPAAPRTTPGATPRASIELRREVELVDRAMAALRRGDADQALRVVRVYAAEAGDRGQLTQDAEAIEVEALCLLHDPGAGDRLARFVARFPRSAQHTRLAAACK